MIATWIAEVQGERLSAERVVAEHAPRRAPTALEIRAMVEELGEMTRVLASTDPEDKARLYAELGLTLTYRPSDKTVAVEAKPRVGVWTCRRGDLTLSATRCGSRGQSNSRREPSRTARPERSDHSTRTEAVSTPDHRVPWD